MLGRRTPLGNGANHMHARELATWSTTLRNQVTYLQSHGEDTVRKLALLVPLPTPLIAIVAQVHP